MDWSVVAPKLEKALETAGGTHTVADVLAAVERGDMQIWPGRRSVLVTELVQYPRLRAVRVFAGAGDLGELLEMERAIAEWGAAQGCQRIEGFGRLGWRRALQGRAYDVRVFMWRGL
jgi:hypothetical protein